MKTVEKKTWPEYFQAIMDGRKTFDLRLADWEIEVGDTLILKEWDPESKDYTGRELRKEVTYVIRTKEVEQWDMFTKDEIEEHGFQIISFAGK